jgi:hypothetical protein
MAGVLSPAIPLQNEKKDPEVKKRVARQFYNVTLNRVQ